jgi:hypothetical protein
MKVNLSTSAGAQGVQGSPTKPDFMDIGIMRLSYQN